MEDRLNSNIKANDGGRTTGIEEYAKSHMLSN